MTSLFGFNITKEGEFVRLPLVRYWADVVGFQLLIVGAEAVRLLVVAPSVGELKIIYIVWSAPTTDGENMIHLKTHRVGGWERKVDRVATKSADRVFRGDSPLPYLLPDFIVHH